MRGKPNIIIPRASPGKLTPRPFPAADRRGKIPNMNRALLDPPDSSDIWSVSRLNREARFALENGFPPLWVEGEVSNLARPASGHLYFSLKDADAQINCAMFRPMQRNLRHEPSNGDLVRVRARVSLFEAQGKFQLKVEALEAAGAGALQRAFEELKRKLEAEGLFDPAWKRALPYWPRRIGVITSPTGAAIRDILTTLKRRYPVAEVIVYPVPVQGEGAGKQIAAMLQQAGQRGECDVFLLARGGGSLEDLWSFNEEIVARAVRACPVPVVSGVGHEIDFTIADFAADYRAPTPTAAAEAVSPDRLELIHRLQRRGEQLGGLLRNRLTQERNRLNGLGHRLRMRSPARQLGQQSQRLDELELRGRRALRRQLQDQRQQLQQHSARLRAANPARRLAELNERLERGRRELRRSIERRLAQDRERLTNTIHNLDLISPLATLERGYAISRDPEDGRVLRDAAELTPGTRVETMLASGSFTARVEEVTREHSLESARPKKRKPQ